jgi:hypothetical protein
MKNIIIHNLIAFFGTLIIGLFLGVFLKQPVSYEFIIINYWALILYIQGMKQ